MNTINRKFIRYISLGCETRDELNYWVECLPFISNEKKKELYLKIRNTQREVIKNRDKTISLFFKQGK